MLLKEAVQALHTAQVAPLTWMEIFKSDAVSLEALLLRLLQHEKADIACELNICAVFTQLVAADIERFPYNPPASKLFKEAVAAKLFMRAQLILFTAITVSD